jgi:hypothetical protein
MGVAVGGNGSADLAALAARLKLAGAGGLRLQLLRGLKTGAAPLVDKARESAAANLPKSGGLAARVANSPIKVAVRTSASNAGVRITASEHDTRPTNAGYVRHPVFGHMDRFVSQEIPSATGWFTKPMESGGPAVTVELLAVIEAVGRQIQGI